MHVIPCVLRGVGDMLLPWCADEGTLELVVEKTSTVLSVLQRGAAGDTEILRSNTASVGTSAIWLMSGGGSAVEWSVQWFPLGACVPACHSCTITGLCSPS